ncbi:hypothetical protein KP509_02G062200 [Ceratopteris richardii]|nr:hypothetical protein KP509_02G062200 [Ceratopteris richardii]
MTPPVSVSLLKAAGAVKGSNNSQKEKGGTVTEDQVSAIAVERVLVINALTMESLKTGSICCDGSAASTLTCHSSIDLHVLTEEKLDNVQGKSIVKCQSSADFNVLIEEKVNHMQKKVF